MSSLSPSRTVVTSFTPRRRLSPVTSYQQQSNSTDESTAGAYYEDGDWVLCVTANTRSISDASSSSPGDWIGCALSNGQVHVYDAERLHLIQCYEKVHLGPDAIVSDITTNGACPNVLVTSGTDGRVCFFDIRQQATTTTNGTPVLSFGLPRAPQEQALSVALGYQGQLVAVGSSKAHVHFFDVRQTGNLLGSYVDAHTEEVTRLQFQPSSNNSSTTLLATGSEDGLVCTFDTSQPSEELALKSVLNVQSPIRQIRFFGPNYEGLCCLTGSETMSVWHHDAAQRIHDYFGLDLRQRLSQATNMVSASASIGGGLTGGIALEYLVDCHWHESQQQLYLLAGNPFGDAALVQVHPTGAFQICNTLGGGHKGVIRGWFPLTSSSQGGMKFVTVGEDARLCEWDNGGIMSATTTTTTTVRDDVAMNEAAAVSMRAPSNALSSPLHPFMPASVATAGQNSNNHHHNSGGKHRRKRPRCNEETWNSSPY